MSEASKNFESTPVLQLYQVILERHEGSMRRAVIIQFLNGYLGTSTILDEGLATERLAHGGSANIAEIEPTDEIRDRQRVVDSYIRNLGKDTPEVREAMQNVFPIV